MALGKARVVARPTKLVAAQRAQTPVAGAAPAKKERRCRYVFLPSGRIARFVFPFVEEFLRLQERALSDAFDGNDKPNPADVTSATNRLALRKFLRGLTEVPVPRIYKREFNEAETRRAIEHSLAVEVADIKARIERGEVSVEGGGEFDSEAYAAERIDRLVDAACVAALDQDAMVKSAPFFPVNDAVWDTGTGYFLTMRESYGGTVEAMDWSTLYSKAMDLVRPFMRAGDGPKANGSIQSSSDYDATS